jgi:hypothetical protein
VDVVVVQDIADRSPTQHRDQLGSLLLAVAAGGRLGRLDQRPELRTIHAVSPLSQGIILDRGDRQQGRRSTERRVKTSHAALVSSGCGGVGGAV